MDRMVVYVKNCLIEYSEIEQINNLKIINSTIKIYNNSSIKVQMYRLFVNELKLYLDNNRNLEKHFVIGYFNINIGTTIHSIFLHSNSTIGSMYC